MKPKIKIKYKVLRWSHDPEYPWNAQFSIDNQTFTLGGQESKAHAKWMVENLKTAFKKLQS